MTLVSQKRVLVRSKKIVVSDEMVEQVKNAIIKSSASGKIGDGKIFISPIEEVVRIRTGEINEDAL